MHASAIPKSIHTRQPSISVISRTTEVTEISPPSSRKNFQTLISLLADFRVRHFLSQANAEDSAIREARCFFKSHGSLGKSNHAFFCLKTLKGFYLTTRGVHSAPSSPRFQNWGMTVSGKCLTAKISAFPKAENACLLLDILEEQPDQKYFLSETTWHRGIKRIHKGTYLLPEREGMNIETCDLV